MANTDSYEWRLVGTTLTAAATDRILPVINSHFYFVLNEAGSGSITIPLNSTAASAVTEGMLVVLYYRGAIRGSFLVENIRKVPASTQEGTGEVMSISGRGGMTVLERAIIWDDGTANTTREFSSVTKASILITLITEAQARTGLSTLTYDFDATNDSDAVAWTDSETYKLNVGTNLLDVVRQFAKTGIDFEVTYSGTGFVLSAYKNGIGTDKTATEYFRTGTNCQEIDIDQRGNDIKNALLVAYKSGSIVVSDSTSITTNGRREELLDARLAQTSASATTYGSAILETKKDTRIGRTINVYDGIPPNLFVDYILGDTVSLDIEGTVTEDRILGIQCDFNQGYYSNVIIELNSLMLEQNIKLQQDVDWLLNQWNTAHDADLLEVSYWAAIGATTDIAASFRAFAVSGNYLYAGGSFSNIGGVSSSYIARYDMTTGIWAAVGNATGIVNAICVIGANVYYAGAFDYIYKWDGTSQSTLANLEAASTIYALATDGTDLYVGGSNNFTLGAPGGIAKYTVATTTWSALGSGLNNTCRAILYTGGNLYAGGAFTASGATSMSKVGVWNGSAWSAMSTGLDNTVYALAAYGSNILAGGAFTSGISEWSGAAWAVFGGGVNNTVYGITVYLTDVYATGAFTDVGAHIAKYSGGAWWELTTGLNNDGYVIAVNGTEQDVYVGGVFTQAGDKVVAGIAAYFTNFESVLDYLENSSGFDMGAAIHNATASAITDTDEVPFWESVANALRKITWANVKATLKTYFDTLYVSITGTSDTQILFNDGGAVGGDADLTWDKTNNVMNIGGTPPSAAASSLNQDASGVSVGHFLWTHGATFASYLTGVFSRGTKASPTQSLSGDIALKLRGRWHDDSTYGNTAAEIRYVANQDQTTTAHGARVEIHTTPDGSTTLTKVLTIGADGSLKNGADASYVGYSDLTTGDEELLNTEFTTNADNWTLGAGWAWESDGAGGGWIRHTAGNTASFYQAGSLSEIVVYDGQIYVGGTAGTVDIYLDNGLSQQFAAGVGVSYFHGNWMALDTQKIRITPSSDFDGYISWVRIHRVKFLQDSPFNEDQSYARSGGGWAILGTIAFYDTTDFVATVTGDGVNNTDPNNPVLTFPTPAEIGAADTDVATTSAAGLAPQATAPAAGLMNFVGLTNGETVYTNKPLFDTTNPATLGTAAPGTQVIAARRDHVHALPTVPLMLSAHGLNATIAASTTAYIAPGSTTFAVGASQNTLVTLAGTAKNMYVRIGAQPATGTLVFKLRVNNVATSVVITVAAGAGAGTYSNLVNTAAIAAGDLVGFEIVNNATGASAAISAIVFQLNVSSI